MDKEVREKRKDFFELVFQEFSKQETLLKFSEKVDLQPNQITLIEDAAKKVNDRYWYFLDKFIYPIIRLGLKENEELDVLKHVDLYKILSATELAISSVQPFDVSEGDLDGKFYFQQLYLNAYVGYKAACAFVKHWQSDNDTFQKYFDESTGKSIFGTVVDYVESVTNRENSMTIEHEHFHIIALSSQSNKSPIYTNSTWWRLSLRACHLELKAQDLQAELDKLKSDSSNN